MSPPRKKNILWVAFSLGAVYVLWLGVTVLQLVPQGWWTSWVVGISLLASSTACLLLGLARKRKKPATAIAPAHQTFQPPKTSASQKTSKRSSLFVFDPDEERRREQKRSKPNAKRGQAGSVQRATIPEPVHNPAPSLGHPRAGELHVTQWNKQNTPNPYNPNTEELQGIASVILAAIPAMQAQQAQIAQAQYTQAQLGHAQVGLSPAQQAQLGYVPTYAQAQHIAPSSNVPHSSVPHSGAPSMGTPSMGTPSTPYQTGFHHPAQAYTGYAGYAAPGQISPQDQAAFTEIMAQQAGVAHQGSPHADMPRRGMTHLGLPGVQAPGLEGAQELQEALHDEEPSLDLGHFPLDDSGDQNAVWGDDNAVKVISQSGDSIDVWQYNASYNDESAEEDAILHSHLEDYSLGILYSQDAYNTEEHRDMDGPLSRAMGDMAMSSSTLFTARGMQGDIAPMHPHDNAQHVTGPGQPHTHDPLLHDAQLEEVEDIIASFQKNKGEPIVHDNQDASANQNAPQGALQARLKKLRSLTHEMKRVSDQEPAQATSPLASYTGRTAKKKTAPVRKNRNGMQHKRTNAPEPAAPPPKRPDFSAFDVPTRRADSFYQDAIKKHEPKPPSKSRGTRKPKADYTMEPFKESLGTMSSHEINKLWQSFVEANRQCGRNPNRLRPTVFWQHLKKNYEAICHKFKCRSVRFTVKIKGGRPALSARPSHTAMAG